MSPEKCLQQLREGQHTAVFRRLYHLLPGLRKWLKQRGGSADEAEDLLQESLIVLYRQSQNPQFNLTVKPETYAFAVAKNLYAAACRKKGIQIELSVEDLNITDAENLAELQEKETRLQHLYNSLQAMGETCRELLLRFYFRREKMASIAQSLGFRNEQVAKAMKYKCLEKAREIVQQQTYSHETY
ncbi:MAG: sigma-70 family RNA polymerase sigma factor [Bacteroidetes bacterium]|nr:sigma-70 family RNA polymerase sigma factor [Bacteroidota bacterium]